jgi:hypothetical protein
MLMLRQSLSRIALALLACLWASLAFGQQGTPFIPADSSSERVAIANSSGNVAAGTATATLPLITGKTSYLCGWSITSTGSTATAIVSPTVTNVQGGTQTYTYVTVAGVAAANAQLNITYTPCLPANAAANAPTVTLPSLGAGNTNATVNAWGYAWGQ